MAAAIDATSPGLNPRAASPANSMTGGILEAATGKPQAMASTTGSPPPS